MGINVNYSLGGKMNIIVGLILTFITICTIFGLLIWFKNKNDF